MEKTAEVFPENLKDLRILRGLTQDTLSERLGVTVHTVQNWEAARRTPDVASIYALSVALECDPGDLLGKLPDEIRNLSTRSPVIAEILVVLPSLKKDQLNVLLATAKLFRDINPLPGGQRDGLAENH